MKNLFDEECLKRISASLGRVYPAFDQKSFNKLMPQLKPLEMKSRVRFLRDEIKKQLPSEYPKALKIILKSSSDGSLRGFDLWPYTEFVQTYGLEHLEISLAALKTLTPLFTSEWAIRPFIKRYPKETMKFLLASAGDKDVHVRRWSSEGTRPRLPWGEQLRDFVLDPSPTLPILQQLRFDSELYVRKSVSNHLNDISKDHPDVVIQTLLAWKKQAGAEHARKVDWVIRRALRSLIKEGHAGALNLIGVSQKAKIELSGLKSLQKKIKLGERIEFQFEVRSLSKSSQKLVVDYMIHFVKSNQSTAAKVFKLKTFELPGLKTVVFKKSHHVKKITTREYYSGQHFIEIQINGLSVGKVPWLLQTN